MIHKQLLSASRFGPFGQLFFFVSKNQIFAQFLPLRFTRANGLNKPGKITLLCEDGVKQVVDLLQDYRSGIMRFGKGWRKFCEAHGLMINESFVLELFWEDEVSPVLKFCRKVNSV